MDRIYQQNLILSSGKFQKEKEYWIKKLSGLEAIDFQAQSDSDYQCNEEIKEKYFSLPDPINQSLIKMSNKSDRRLFILLVALLKILIYKYSGIEDFAIICPVESSGIDGELFNKLLILRDKLTDSINLKELVYSLRDTYNQSVENQNFPYNKLLELLNIPLNRPLGVGILLENIHSRKHIDSDLSQPILVFNRIDNKIEGYILFKPALYNRDFIERFLNYFVRVAIKILNNPGLKISDLELVTDEEKRKVLCEFNNTNKTYPEDKSIQELFIEQVKKTPDNIACQYGDNSLTYEKLNKLSDQVAYYLINKGIELEDVVGIMVEPSLEMIIGLLGILKAGAAYLPLDPLYPDERLKYMLENSSARFLLTQKQLSERKIVSLFSGKILIFEEIPENFSDIKGEINQPLVKGNNLAYVIYTSGSTGLPKGVMVEHHSVINLIYWHIKKFSVSESDRATKYAGFGFDASVWEIYPYLLSGGTIVIVPPEIKYDLDKLAEWFEDKKISISFLPTKVAEKLMENYPDLQLRYLLVGGERLTKVVKTSYQVVNNYGPTENTVVTTSYNLHKEDIGKIPPIGKPIDNTQVYILDKWLKPVPIEMVGEIYVSGVGLARGYINQPQITEQRFIPDPYKKGALMYKTGDLGCWLEDGNVEFRGRSDRQIKIRGYRIELEEIEKILLKVPEIQEALVEVRSFADSDECLVAYLVAKNEPDLTKIKEFLKNNLPQYMIPSHFMYLSQFPLTPNGKIDIKALQEMTQKSNFKIDYKPPRDEVEKKLAGIFAEVLGQEKISIDADFFEMGGHSLKATQIVSGIFKEFGVKISFNYFFNHSTISEIAVKIKDLRTEPFLELMPQDEREYYPLSYAQKRLWLMDQLSIKKTAYNISTALLIQGELDIQALSRAFERIVQRHEILRTKFDLIEGHPCQIVNKDVVFNIGYYNLCGQITPGLGIEDEKVKKLLKKELEKPFDLKNCPLIRGICICLDKFQYLFVLSLHHIIADGWSVNIIINEMSKLYNNFTKGEEIELPPLKIQYRDYATWQIQLVESGHLYHQEEFWVEEFKNPVTLNLPTDYSRPAQKSYQGDYLTFDISKDITEKLKKLAYNEGSTLFQLLLTCYYSLLYYYSRQDEIIVGIPVAARSHKDLEGIVGFFVNTLAVKIQLDSKESFKILLNRVKEKTLQAFENQDYPFDLLVEKVLVNRDLSRSPLFDTMFNLLNMLNEDSLNFNLTGLKVELVDLEIKTSKFDLMLTLMEKDGSLRGSIEYSTDLFKETTIYRMIGHFKNLLTHITKNPDLQLGRLDLLSQEEKYQILVEFNKPDGESIEPGMREPVRVHKFFEKQVELTPHQTALGFMGQSLTYAELNYYADKFAHCLRLKGVKRNTLVGVMINRSFEMIVTLLGILKAGGAYLPLDPYYPRQRINYILKDSGVNILVTQSQLKSQVLECFTGELIVIDSLLAPDLFADDQKKVQLSGEPSRNLPDDLVYVIYTSGSTGQPKGVGVNHQILSNLLYYQLYKTNIDYSGRMLQFTSLSFDVSFQEIFTPLSAGGEVYLISDEDRRDISKLLSFLQENFIEIISLPFSYLNLIFNDWNNVERLPQSLKHIITAGEQVIITENLRKYLISTDVYLHNHYGPSETHVVTTLTLKGEDELPLLPPIGRPIMGVKIYILDDNLQPVPIGVPGEIYIGGVAVSSGYISHPDLTAERFIPDPYSTGKIYKTGDVGKWLDNGNIQFLGRVDNQVKIRGYRIEPGEIESVLLIHPEIQKCAVIDKKDKNGLLYLKAYLVVKKVLTLDEVKEYLLQTLPDYMIPAVFVIVEDLPMTPSGKIDRKALLSFNDGVLLKKDYIPPEDDIEKKIASIWSSVLELPQVGIYDNFFELGGHSLKAAIIISKIKKEMGQEISLQTFFKKPTVSEQAEILRKKSDKICQAFLEIKPNPARNSYPVTHGQKSLWIMEQKIKGNLSYNMPGALILKGKLNIDALCYAFQQVVNRHEILRTAFFEEGGEVKQVVVDNFSFELSYQEGYEGELTDYIHDWLIIPFDLSHPCLMRAELIKLNDEEHLLLFNMHHIITDGWSMNLLLQELGIYYQAYLNRTNDPLNPLDFQYRDYSIWQNEMLNKGYFKSQENFWMAYLKGKIPRLSLPGDNLNLMEKKYFDASEEIFLDGDLVKKLTKMTEDYEATLFMIFVAVLNILIHKLTGHKDILIGTSVAGRKIPGLEKLIGFFVNTLVLRTDLSKNPSFLTLLENVIDTTLKAYDNQDYPYELLVERLREKEEERLNTELFRIMVNYLPEEVNLKDLFPGIELVNISHRIEIAKFDLNFYVFPGNDEIQIRVVYKTSLFSQETINTYLSYLVNIFKQISENPHLLISEIELINPGQQELMIADFMDDFEEDF